MHVLSLSLITILGGLNGGHMSYVIEQKSGKNVYLYEVESYWDKDKKQSRQKRRYLGKKDQATGETITPRKSVMPKEIFDYGHIHAVRNVAQQTKIISCLKQAFGDDYNEIMHLAYYQVLEAKPMYMQKVWAESSYIKEHLALSSQQISKLLNKIGSNNESRTTFFKKWIRQQDKQTGSWIDITSFSSYAKNIDFCEWGYNRDKEKLPQINLGMLLGDPTKIPLYYHVYPGSIADVSTLSNLTKIVKSFGANINSIVLDRGYYSSSNIKTMIDEGLEFVIPLPANVKETSRLLKAAQPSLDSPLNSFQLHDEILFSYQDEIIFDNHKINAFVYMDDKRRTQEIQLFLKRIHDLESLVANKKFKMVDDVKDCLNGVFKGSSRYFDISLKDEVKNSVVILERNEQELKETLSRAGKMVLITNKINLKPAALLQLYRQRDSVEKIFDAIKNELNQDRLRVHSRENMEGRLFIAFIAVVLYTVFLQKLKDSDLIKKYSVAKAVMELKKIRAIRVNDGKEILSEISKKQRLIMDALGVSVPVKPSY